MQADPEFLREEAIRVLHEDQIAEFGGAQGIRDPGLLSSAAAQAGATVDGEYLHHDLHEMAAAYLYHIAMNHPFIDGNKRTAVVAALVLLDLNGIDVDRPEPRLFDLTLGVAEGRIGKGEVASQLRYYFPSA